jgi:isopentenyl diphosphate isomerase/L-lactate dehydrogenase-like FMN-dependent dehydrogenase
MSENEKSTGKFGGKAKCGAKNRRGGLCGHPAGYQTDHLGVGRCKFHGGASPIKHGRYSKIPRERLKQWIEHVESDENPLDLIPDIQLVRALIMQSLDGKKALDITAASELVERLSRIVQRYHDMQEKRSISFEQWRWIQTQMGLVVAGCVKDADTLRAIESGWASIVVKP